MELSKSMGKVPIILKDVPGDTGFVGNRIMAAVRREAAGSAQTVKQSVSAAADTLAFGVRAGQAAAYST